MRAHGDSHEHENSRDSEAALGTCDVLGQRMSWGVRGALAFGSEKDGLQVVREAGTHGQGHHSGRLRSSGTLGVSS